MTEATTVVPTGPTPMPESTSPDTPPIVETSDPAAPPAETPPSRTFNQEDVDKIVAKRLGKAQRQWERQQQELLRTALEARGQPTTQAAPPQAAEGAPDPANFPDFGQYVQALVAHGVQSALQENQKNAQRMTVQEQAQQRQQIIAGGVQKQFAAGSEKYEDFEDLVMNPDLSINAVMAESIAESELGAEIAYHLGKNPAEADRIARLSPIAAAREIGKIEAKLAQNPPPPVTKAPTPLTPVNADGKGTKDPSSMSDAEFAAWRKKQIAARKGRY